MASVQTPTREVDPPLGPADQFMLRLLRLPEDDRSSEEEARTAFQTSIFISSVRCLLTYIVLPFIVPTFTFFATVARPIEVVVSIAALVSITMSMRRFWRARHPKRWAYGVLGGTMFVFVSFMLVSDLVT